ncbi:hypothetical protein QCA50_005372 [Cerrena zonata]|uniref:Mitochondrial import inner membrane translocase subunit TIM50 n=1 Tax=Cerrena zonata TaxID=2478898 RepID=A0AAW0GJC0_9APHY
MNPLLLARSPALRGVVLRSARRFASTNPPKPKAPSASEANRAQNVKSDAREPITPAPTPSTSSVPSLDFSPVEESQERERTGARSSKDSLSSIERRRRFMSRVSLAFMLFGAGMGTWYLGRDWEDGELKELRIKPEEAPTSRWGRTTARFGGVFNFFTEPIWPELLPPPLPNGMQKPYTLLVSVDDLLVTSTWDRHHGWRTAKRPGVDYFIAYLSQFYEVVIFTTQYHYTANAVIDKLDPYQFFIQYRLFRDATRSVNGTPVKDLTYLNRDLSKVILLDTHPEHASAQPENAVILPKWTGDAKDRGLVAMIPFLESIAIYKPADVRPILEAYHDKDIPIEYAKKEAEAKQKHIEEWTRKGKQAGSLTLSSLFGGSSSPGANSPVPLTYLEQKRLEAQMQYREEQAYINTNKATFDKMIKEEQEAMAQQIPGTFWGAASALMGGVPPPPPPPQGQSAQTPGAETKPTA